MNKRKLVNIVLPLIGLGVIVFYNFCGSSCTFLKGDVLGIDLKYLGILYALLLLVLTLLQQQVLRLAALGFGIGMEVNLLAFQVKNSTYCPYCLIFAAILVFLFLFNFERSRKAVAGVAVVVGFLACLLFFRGIATPAYAEETLIPTYGTGKVKVRLYTDYFCGPCSRLEPKAERLIVDLVKKNAITLTFVDTPVHTGTPLYARYFLYIVNYDRSFAYALTARAVLFEAAKQKISEQEKLEEYLKQHKVKFKPFDPKASFVALTALIQEDKINSTPRCVIIEAGKKAQFVGPEEIIKALELLK